MEKENFKDFIKKLESLDGIKLPDPKIEFVTYSITPLPKDEVELQVQNIFLKNGIPYNQNYVETISQVLRDVPRIRNYKIDENLRKALILTLWKIYNETPANRKMTTMNTAFWMGMAFYENMEWVDLNDTD